MALRVVSVASSMPLQKLLHFNSFYAFAYGASHIALSVWKGTQLQLGEPARIAQPILAAVWILVEILRLRLGYSGNLGGKVPELAAFWLLTILPQLPLTVFMSFIQIEALMPLEIAVGIPMTLFLAGELRLGLITVRDFIRNQTADFYRVCQEEALAREARARPRGAGYSLSGVSAGDLDRAMSGVGVTAVMREGARALAGRPNGIVMETTASLPGGAALVAGAGTKSS
jgi:transmembrane protein 17